MKNYKMTIILGSILIILSFISLFIGVMKIDIGSLFKGDEQQLIILFKSRFPRLLAILCTGFGMSIAGLIMQKLCSNKFVSPTTGATISGAQLGILISLIILPQATTLFRSLFAFLVSMAATSIFILFITRIKFKDQVMVPLIGIMISNIVSGVTSFIAYKYDATQTISSYMTGSFAGIIEGNYEIVYLVVPLIIVTFIFANHFNIVSMGKSFSKNLGVNYNLMLVLGLSITALITASIVVTVGSISYIGLIIPNIVTMIKGDRLRGTLLETGILGAIFVLVCDCLGRLIIKPYELPIELIVGIIGSVLFIGLIVYRMKAGNKSIKLFERKKDADEI